jgi:hypothetical protein
MTQRDLSDRQRELCPFCYRSVAVREGRFVEHSRFVVTAWQRCPGSGTEPSPR